MHGMNVRCPGCGMLLPEAEWPKPGGFAASKECWQKYGELASVTQALRDPSFPHQHAVDAYAAQHASPDSPLIKTTFALIGLYLACERGFTGRQVQLEHIRLAKVRRDWPRFFRKVNAAMTVADATPANLLGWAAAVWREWSPDHDRVKALL